MRMTEALKNEAVRIYFEEGKEPEAIAAQMGATLRQIKTALSDLKRLEAYRRRSEAAKLRAQICVNESAEEAARRQAGLLRGGESDSTQQRAAKDILDRAGVRVVREDSRDVTITFAGETVQLGMPRGIEEEADED